MINSVNIEINQMEEEIVSKKHDIVVYFIFLVFGIILLNFLCDFSLFTRVFVLG